VNGILSREKRIHPLLNNYRVFKNHFNSLTG